MASGRMRYFNVVLVLKRLGWTVDGIAELLARYPNGIAQKYCGRLRDEVVRVYNKTKEPPPHALRLTFFDDLTEDPTRQALADQERDRARRNLKLDRTARQGQVRTAHRHRGSQSRRPGLARLRTKGRSGVVYFALERADLVRRRLIAHKLRDDLARPADRGRRARQSIC